MGLLLSEVSLRMQGMRQPLAVVAEQAAEVMPAAAVEEAVAEEEAAAGAEVAAAEFPRSPAAFSRHAPLKRMIPGEGCTPCFYAAPA